jgi:hypothetical protein
MLLGLFVVAAVIANRDRDAVAATTAPTNTIAGPENPATEAPATEPPATTVIEQDAELPEDLAIVTGPWETDWSRRTIELDELKIGIPTIDPRDRIAPIDSPAYEPVDAGAAWLEDRELGILFELGETARFYPLRILTSHEIVNDEVGGVSFAVTYCPLCNTAVAYSREVEGRVLRFGVSGLLRNSDLVMWDDATQSLWQQITGEGIVGEFAGTQLEFLPTALVRFADFAADHPDGEVLSRETGFPYDYGGNAYVGYSSRSAPFAGFFDGEPDPRFPALERVVGVRIGAATKAFPFSVIAEEQAVNDVVGGEPVTVWWGAPDTADPLDDLRVADGRGIGTGVAYVPVVDQQVLTFTALGGDRFLDAETRSTWNLSGVAVDGPLAGTELELAIHQNEFWFAWAAFNQGSPVYGE